MLTLRFLLSSSTRLFVYIALANIAGGLLGMAQLSVVNHALRIGATTGYISLSGYASLYFGSTLLISVIRGWSKYTTMHLARNGAVQLQMRTISGILSSPLERSERLGSARLLAIFSEDIPAVTSAIRVALDMMSNFTAVLGGLFYLGFIAPWVLLITIPVVVLGLALGWLMSRTGVPLMRSARIDADYLFKHFRSLTEGLKDLKTYAKRREAFLTSFEQTSDSYLDHSLKGAVRLIPSEQVGILFMSVVLGMVLFFPQQLGLSSPAASCVALLWLGSRIGALFSDLYAFVRAETALQLLEEKNLNLPISPASDTTEKIEPDWKKLELRDVTYSYEQSGDSSGFKIGPLNLDFCRGQLIFMTGGNGSGKTSLAKLLIGLYVPSSGTINIDGVSVTPLNIGSYQQLFSTVFADNFLFEELLFPDTSQVDERCQLLLQKMRLDSKVSIKNGAFSTIALSQGQRKRLALVGAYANDSSIMLFDEWAAEQDPEFKQLFYCELLPELRSRGKLVFVITHDDKYFSIADKIVHLEDGKLQRKSL